MPDAHVETTRVEAFSDGVFAIAITLLILEIKVPHEAAHGRLAGELLRLWPSYLAFLVSFANIGVMWVNHHRLFGLIRRSDDGLVGLNLLLAARGAQGALRGTRGRGLDHAAVRPGSGALRAHGRSRLAQRDRVPDRERAPGRLFRPSSAVVALRLKRGRPGA
jgi:hypothetical protein